MTRDLYLRALSGARLVPHHKIKMDRWIIYLDPTIHQNEFKLIKNANLDSLISIQDIRKSKLGLPSWMSVLPALVDTQTDMAWRGPSCLEKILSIELPKEHVMRLKRRGNKRLIDA
jgi:hypothetical protein